MSSYPFTSQSPLKPQLIVIASTRTHINPYSMNTIQISLVPVTNHLSLSTKCHIILFKSKMRATTTITATRTKKTTTTTTTTTTTRTTRQCQPQNVGRLETISITPELFVFSSSRQPPDKLRWTQIKIKEFHPPTASQIDQVITLTIAG